VIADPVVEMVKVGPLNSPTFTISRRNQTLRTVTRLAKTYSMVALIVHWVLVINLKWRKSLKNLGTISLSSK